jgi:hypothetical protein
MATASLELPQVFTTVHPESQAFVDAFVAYNEALAQKKAREAASGILESSAVVDPEKLRMQEEMLHHWAFVDTVAIEHSLDARRDLAGRMIAKITADGCVLSSPARSHATVQRATYHGVTEVTGESYYWTTALEAWRYPPPQGGDERVLDFDEQITRRERTLQQHPSSTSRFTVAKMATFLSKDRYPVFGRIFDLETMYSSLSVATDSMGAGTDHGITHENYPLVAIALTPDRIDEIGTFIDALEPTTVGQ